MYDEKFLGEEFIGLHVKIKECKDPTWKGKSGLIIDESKNTFLIEMDEKQKKIAKKTAVFEFDVNSEKIIVDGSKITFRPEDRIKKIKVKKRWQKKK